MEYGVWSIEYGVWSMEYGVETIDYRPHLHISKLAHYLIYI